MSTSVPSADAKAVVRAIEGLTTRLGRALDALSTPVVEAADDDATTPATTCSALHTGFPGDYRQCIRAAQHHGDHIDEQGFHWSDIVAVYPVDPGVVREALPTDDGPRCVCGDPIEPWTGPGEPGWIHSPGSDTPCLEAHLVRPALAYRRPQAPAADEDAQRTARRVSLRHLLERAERGALVSLGEGEKLRHLVEEEIREADKVRSWGMSLARRSGQLLAARRTWKQKAEEIERDRDIHCAELEQAQAERDGAYRERAQLLALLASLHPSVIAPAPDVDEPGWQILYLRIGGKQASWHIAPRDAELFAHVENVPGDDSRAQWDGHTTEEKYAHIGEHAARLYAEARGRVETALTPATLDGAEQPEPEPLTVTPCKPPRMAIHCGGECLPIDPSDPDRHRTDCVALIDGALTVVTGTPGGPGPTLPNGSHYIAEVYVPRAATEITASHITSSGLLFYRPATEA